MPIAIQNVYFLCKKDCAYPKGSLLRVEKIETSDYFKVFILKNSLYPNGEYGGRIEAQTISDYLNAGVFIQGNQQSLKRAIALL